MIMNMTSIIIIGLIEKIDFGGLHPHPVGRKETKNGRCDLEILSSV